MIGLMARGSCGAIRGARAAHTTKQKQNQAAEGRGAVGEESPDELRKPRLGFELRGIVQSSAHA